MAVPATILLVDDDPFVAQLYGHSFASYGLRVTTVENAEDALKYAIESPPKLLITDVNMPGMNGFEMAAELKRRGKKCFPLFFFTAHDDLDVLTSGLEAGGDAFLIKGSGLPEIIERISFWMRTGFLHLPTAARVKALDLAELAKKGSSKPIKEAAELDPALSKSIAEQAAEEVMAVHKDYGNRMVERIYFLGRLSHLVLEACTDLKSILRFPDYLMASVKGMNFPWLSDLYAMLRYYDRLEKDPRFCAAAEQGLVSISDGESE